MDAIRSQYTFTSVTCLFHLIGVESEKRARMKEMPLVCVSVSAVVILSYRRLVYCASGQNVVCVDVVR